MARLSLSAEEEEIFLPQLRQIIDYFDQLSQLEVADEEEAEISATLEAQDVLRPSLDRRVFLENAPQIRAPFLLVPQVKATGRE